MGRKAGADSTRSGVAWPVRHGLLLTVVATVLVRLVHWLSVRAFDPLYAQTPAGTDMHTYLAWAKAIVAGDWLSAGFTGGQPFFYGPLYPYFLAFLLRLFGENYDAIHAAQALIGVVPPIAMWSACRRLFGKGPALATGLLTAVCVPIFFYEQVLLMEGLLMAIEAGVLWCLIRGQAGGSKVWLWPLSAGVLSGMACWGRGSFLLVIPLIAVGWVIARRVEGRPRPGAFWKDGLACGGVYLIGCAMPLGLTLSRNVHVSGRYVLTTSNGPVTLYMGNASDATGDTCYSRSFVRRNKDRGRLESERAGLDKDLYAAVTAGDTVRVEALTRQTADVQRWLERFWTGALLEELRSGPRRWAGLMLSKTWMFWNAYEVPDNVSYYAAKRYSWVMRWCPVTWLTVIPLAALGMLWSLRAWRTQVFLYLYAVGFPLSIILVFICGRYRLAEVLPLLVWAGVAVSRWLDDARRRRWAVCVCAAAGVTAGIVVLWPTWSPAARRNAPHGGGSVQFVRVQDYLGLAEAHYGLGQRQQARDVLEEAVRAYPANSYVAMGLAKLYGEGGSRRRAIETLEAVRERGAASADVTLMLADFYAGEGQQDRAVALLQQLLRREPRNAAALAFLRRLQPSPR